MGGRTNQVTHECLGWNLSPTYEWKDEPSHQQVLWYKIYVLLTTGGRTNQVTHECFGRNLSPSTYGWKDEPSHLRAPWSKFEVLLPTSGKTNQATSKRLGTKFKSFYLRVEGRTKSLTIVLVKIFRSSYLRVEGPTKSPTSALVKIRSLLTYGRTNKPCHPKGPWLKFKSPAP